MIQVRCKFCKKLCYIIKDRKGFTKYKDLDLPSGKFHKHRCKKTRA